MDSPCVHEPPPPTADDVLIARWRAGEPDAFEQIFNRYRDRLTAYAWRMVRRRELAEELCLEAFARVVAGAWKPTGSFRSFLFTVVHRLCLATLKRNRRATLAHLRLVGSPETVSTPEHHASGNQERARLERAMAELSTDHRAVVLLYYGQGLASREVATILDLEDHQVRSRLSYARKRLRSLMDPE